MKSTYNSNKDSTSLNLASDKWLSSKEAMTLLEISSCELMHKRVSGELIFKKIGNAYFYRILSKS